MINILLILIGLLVGLAINFIAEWFYLRRKFFPKDLEEQYERIGILRYVLWPWQWKERLTSHKLRVWLVNLVMAGGAVFFWGLYADLIVFISKYIVLAYFTLVVVMDIEARVVLHPVSIVGAMLGLAYGWLNWGIISSLIGGMSGYAFMFLIYWVGMKVSNFASKKRGEEIEEEPMGFGDVNLTGVLGLMLGWPGIIAGLFLGIITGGAYSLLFVGLKLIRKEFKKYSTIPYAPFLVIGAAIVIFSF